MGIVVFFIFFSRMIIGWLGANDGDDFRVGRLAVQFLHQLLFAVDGRPLSLYCVNVRLNLRIETIDECFHFRFV